MPEQSVVFDRAASFYDNTRGFPPGEDRKVGAFIAQYAGLTSSDQLVEIGIGTGRIALPVAEHVHQIIGFDLSAGMMQRLQEKHQTDFAGVRVFPVMGDVMQLPAASNTFDAALIVHILHLIPHPDQAVNELARVLRPGGRALQCWNDRDGSVFQPLQDAWNGAVDSPKVAQERHRENQNVLNEMGWNLSGEHVYHYSVHESPAAQVNSYRSRSWSALWTLPDEVLRAGVEALEAALQANYPEPEQPVAIPCTFHVKIYTPPA
ncbi:MAG TPA: methyltransferase domain-containing protein [Phototrophicaceae bacterium]|jgi:ubiquinone/menaquinone biosynthesis C-methylase UbiE|nr:methyltransferase domain-containing protein [Phototrophicaceae bacterium]